MTNLSPRSEVALNWLVRLPLLGSYELSMLMDIHEEDAKRLLLDLTHTGWLQADTVSSPELESDRLYALSLPGLVEMSLLLKSRGQSNAGFILHPREIEARWARVETTVGVNRFIAELVLATRSTYNLRVEGVRALPVARDQQSWWPPGVEAFASLRSRTLAAPFFIAWDRAAAPNLHRRKRLLAWNAFYRQGLHPWVHELPATVVLCPDHEASKLWAGAALAAEERAVAVTAPVAIAEIAAVFSGDPLDDLWRAPASSIESPFTDRLSWRQEIPDVCGVPGLTDLPRELSDDARRAAVPVAHQRTNGSQPYSLYRHLGSAEKRVLEWLAYHPLLTTEDLCVLIRCRHHQMRILMGRLQASGFVDSVQRRAAGDTMDDAYFFLTSAALRAIAFRDGVPARRLLHFGGAAGGSDSQTEGRLQTLLRQFDHTVGVNRLAVRLVGDAEKLGHKAVCWLSAADAIQKFPDALGQRWLRPDGMVHLKAGRQVHRLLIEWDRGTERSLKLQDKCETYARFYSSQTKSDQPASRLPRLLFITTTPHREEAILSFLKASFEDEGLVSAVCQTSVIDLIARIGPFGNVWRHSPLLPRTPLLTEGDSHES